MKRLDLTVTQLTRVPLQERSNGGSSRWRAHIRGRSGLFYIASNVHCAFSVAIFSSSSSAGCLHELTLNIQVTFMDGNTHKCAFLFSIFWKTLFTVHSNGNPWNYCLPVIVICWHRALASNQRELNWASKWQFVPKQWAYDQTAILFFSYIMSFFGMINATQHSGWLAPKSLHFSITLP